MHIDASNFLFVSSEMQQLEVSQNETQLDVGLISAFGLKFGVHDESFSCHFTSPSL